MNIENGEEKKMVVETQRLTAKGNDEEEEKKFMNLLRKPRIVRREIY
jgi:hypothetical protein